MGLRSPAARAALLALFAASASAGPSARAPRAPELEYRVKAAFILNFVKFAEWPPNAFERPDAPLALCVLQENPFGDALPEMLAGETAAGRPLSFHIVASAAGAPLCHLLFLPKTHAQQAAAVAAATTNSSVLLVGESAGFLASGGAIRLFVEEGRVRFAIDERNAERRGIRLSSHLLRLARPAPEGLP